MELPIQPFLIMHWLNQSGMDNQAKAFSRRVWCTVTEYLEGSYVTTLWSNNQVPQQTVLVSQTRKKKAFESQDLIKKTCRWMLLYIQLVSIESDSLCQNKVKY